MARWSTSLACLTLAVLASVTAAAAPKAVVELFTSQGCSSCKPADALLEEMAERGDVLPLSLHVDYWDYLGWRDTLATPENTERQRDYARVRQVSRVYTPQIVVNGTTDVVGSDRAGVEAAIAAASLPVPVSMEKSAETIRIVVGASPVPGSRPTTIRLVLFSTKLRVPIERGENAGSTIVYRNVVRSARPIGMWGGSPVRITLPEDELMGNGIDGCAVLVQEDRGGEPGAILGAAELVYKDAN